MELSSKILSDITIFNKYAKYLPEKQRRETWGEICDRYENMMVEKYPQLKEDIPIGMQFIRDKKVLPSMRAMQFAGGAISKNNSRLYNCAYFPVDDYRAFSEAMFLLLGGTGIGYSVQFHHIEKLPEILKPTKEKKYLIGDSLEGWADAIKALVKSYFGITRYKPRFDFSDIRAKGMRLITAGGKAPGPSPLREVLAKIEGVFEKYNNGDKLKPIDVHRIMCHIANSVLSGGIRRSAMIALFSFDDHEMAECKYGNWWEKDEQFGRANNSAVIVRNKVTKNEFLDLWKKIELSNAGEPGIYFTNDKDWGTNPSLRAGTKVLTKNGIFPIEFLENKEFTVPNLNGKWSEAKCWKSGTNVPLWKLTFDNGKEYFTSPQHEWPIYSNGRYIKCSSSELKAGDLMPINVFDREKLHEGNKGNYNLGFTIGWLYGDGSLTQRSDTDKYVASFVVSKTEIEVLPILLETVKNIDGEERKLQDRDSVYEFQVGSPKFINLIMQEYGVNKKEYGLPSNLWTEWSDEMIRGFIDGLFSSDGHVPKDTHGITLTSSKKKLIDDIQELLGFYGIKSNIRQVVINNPTFPNGKRYDKDYISYVLRTTLAGKIQFKNLFKLSITSKNEDLQIYTNGRYDTVSQQYMILKSVELTELKEDVWDISVKDNTHCFHLSTVTTGNCCEIALRPFQFCNLCEVNVSDIKDEQV